MAITSDEAWQQQVHNLTEQLKLISQEATSLRKRAEDAERAMREAMNAKNRIVKVLLDTVNQIITGQYE